MAASTNINGWNIGGNNNSFDQRGHFYRAFLDGNVSGMLVKQNSTPNMTVLVEHGSALLNKNTTSASIAEIKSDTSVTIDTANTSNPRIDTVVIYEDTSVAIPTVENDYWQDGAGGRFKIVSLPGTAGAVPVALSDANIQTAIGAGKPWTRLADITVPANSTTIINSNVNNSVRAELGASLATNSVTTAAIADANVTTAKLADASVSPEKRSGGFFCGVIAGSTVTTTGIKNITGVGFTPKGVKFTIRRNSTQDMYFGVGAMDENGNQHYVYTVHDVSTTTGGGTNGGTTACMYMADASNAVDFVASYSSMDADGFSINVTDASSSIDSIQYEAYA